MALHPHQSRRKRLENVLSLGTFWLIILAMLAVLPMGRDDWTWADILKSVGPSLLIAIGSIAAAVAYVRGGRRP